MSDEEYGGPRLRCVGGPADGQERTWRTESGVAWEPTGPVYLDTNPTPGASFEMLAFSIAPRAKYVLEERDGVQVWVYAPADAGTDERET